MAGDTSSGIVKGYILPIISYDPEGRLAPIYFQTYPIISGDSKSANYDSIEIVGRAEPIQIYKSSGPRSINLELTYVAISEEYDFQWVAQQINRLRALVYPVYSRASKLSNQFVPPPLILLNFGYRYVNVPCVVKQANIVYSADEVVDLDTMLPMITKVSLSLETSYPYGLPPGHDDVVFGKGDFPNAGEGATPVLDEATEPEYDERIFTTIATENNLEAPTAFEKSNAVMERSLITFAGKLATEEPEGSTVLQQGTT